MKLKVIKGVIDTGKDVYHPGDLFDVSDGEAERLSRLGVAEPVETEESDPEESPEFTAISEAVEAQEVTKSGKPTVEALEKRLNRDLTSTERDKIWNRYQKWLTAQ